MIIISGRTYAHRDALKAMGASWNEVSRNWEMPSATASERARLSTMIGVMVSDAPTPIEPEQGDTDDWLEAFFNGRGSIVERTGSTFQYGDDTTYLNHFANKNPVSFFGFSSLARMTEYVENIKASVELDEHRNSGWRNSERFTGTRDMRHAMELAYDGWKEGAEMAAQIAEEIGVAHAVQRKRIHSVSGGRVNVGRLLAGDPRNMVTRAKQQGSRVVTIFVETAINAIISTENAKLRAACIAGLIDIIEQQGYSCELIATNMTAYNRTSLAQLAVRLKSAGEALNINDVIFALGHPSFERRFNFALIGSAEELRKIWSTFGVSSSAFTDKYEPGKNEFYVPQFTDKQQSKIRGDDPVERALSLLPIITPTGLRSFIK